MTSSQKISILVHEFDWWSEDNYPFLGYLAKAWESMGLEVEVVRGLVEPLPETDLVVAHIDRTVTPPEYVEYLGRFPRVVNGRVTDISKRKISENLVSSNDSWPGPVIVKTDLNYGGLPELVADSESGRNEMHQDPVQRPWRRVETLNPHDYPVFANRREVPPGVWRNPRLVAEKFIPEWEDGLYCMRVALFMGENVRCGRSYSESPVIKGASIIRSERIETPPGFSAIREKYGIDYGKIDYVEHDGRIHVIDVNKTPGGLADREVNTRLGGLLAEGILPWLKTSASP